MLPDNESGGFDDGDVDDYKDSADFEKEVMNLQVFVFHMGKVTFIFLKYYFNKQIIQLKVEATFRRALTGVEQDNVIIEINSLR